jgi:hypothetical protein
MGKKRLRCEEAEIYAEIKAKLAVFLFRISGKLGKEVSVNISCGSTRHLTRLSEHDVANCQ